MAVFKESDIKLDIIGKRNMWFTISIVMTLIAVLAMLMGGLKLGIDFTGGTMIQAKFEKDVSVHDVRGVLEAQQMGPVMVQNVGAAIGEKDPGNAIIIRTKPLNPQEQQALIATLQSKLGKFTVQRKDFVGPTIGRELLVNGLIALALVLGGIITYVSFRFRFDYAVCAIVALVHDLLVTVGVFAILGMTVGTEVDSLFVTAVLTVMGFSVHDTIVIFDRIRENTYKAEKRADLGIVTNFSLNQTMARSINTSLTVVITLTALFLFGGVTIRDFTLALLVGIISGTYSSIFVASPLLVVWRQMDGGAKAREAAA